MSNSDFLTSERQDKIIELINEQGSLTVGQICDTFDVSEATARRDLATLATQNVIRRVHGGAVRKYTVATSEAPIIHRQQENADVKKRIGEAAANLINDGETLLLVGGSTGIAVAHELLYHENLTIVTDSLIVSGILLQHAKHTVIMLGGTINRDEHAVRGTLSRIILNQLQVDKVILGTKAISVDRGLSVETPEEAELWRTYLEVAHHVIVVTDSTKFNQSALVQVCLLDSIHTLVTDSNIEPERALQIREMGVYLILA